ncbi:putative alcohol dehydrogenase protein [Phialemonium atrogriseum]|uniref:Alcohol dehydrogenase protein n=1 Tax=Phialemonium atrogriseum TaxID=1093897 RepID=A0AAJ0C1W2_9PEZI|nr:putative alcohol dehydrogenase protein [Phialemonium atrogriseum]KAK1767583.1 putative alcohol dehydrogenase protein [Phialemonium atrogriseum]
MAASAGPLPQLMKAQFLDAFNTPYALRSVPLPELSSPHDILIKVDAASYCHTDAVLAAGQMLPNPPSFPHIGCHEFAGTIVGLPPNSSPSSSPSFRIGDRVGVPGRSFHPCGTCFECASGPTPEEPDADPPGYSVYCPRSHNNGLSGPGGFREYAVVDSRQVAPIPEGMSAVNTAALMCAGVTVYAALKRCGLKPGQRVGVMGCGGGLGHLGLQFAVNMGLKVVGVDNADAPLQLARSIAEGARIVDARAEKAADVVTQLGQEDGKQDRGDMGLDAVIVLPESQAAFDYGVALLRNHGKCIVVSFPEKGFHLSARDVVFRDISIVGSLVGSNKTLREMLQFAAEHNVKANIKTFPLSRLNDLVTEYHRGRGGKLAIDMALPDGP